MDNRLTIGDKMDLEKIDTRLSIDPDRRSVYVSQIMDELADGDILAAMPIQEGKMIPLAVGEQFDVTFYSKSGLLRCVMEVTGRFKKESLYLMKLTQKTVCEKVQRREFFRIECHIPMEYRLIGEEEKKLIESGTLYDEGEMNPEWKNAVALDLSGGGIRFVSAYREEKDAFMQVRFEMPVGEEEEMFYLFATVLSSIQNQNNRGIYDQRVMFWKLNQTLREKIIRSIFEMQRKNRSKKMGMD